MSRPAKKDGQSKYARYRAAKRAKGMKLIRIWVPDPNAAEVREEAKRQGLLLRDRPEEAEALEFIEKIMDWPDEPA